MDVMDVMDGVMDVCWMKPALVMDVMDVMDYFNIHTRHKVFTV